MQVLGVLGAGAMGSGIAQIAATYGWEVQLIDISKEATTASRNKLQKILNRQVEKGRMTDREVMDIMSRIYFGNSMQSFEKANLVIEAIVENLDIKKKVFSEIESIVSNECIIATNTSSLSVTAIASVLKNPTRFLGIHFFNPAPLMKLVEIIPAVQSEASKINKAKSIIDNWGKYTVLAKDTPGFIVNKVARPFYGEAIRIYEEGIASPATIDWAMTNLGKFRMGPFALTDYIGHDVNYKVTESVWKAFYYDSRYQPSFSQKALVDAGYLGRKTGKGFFNYKEGDKNEAPIEDKLLGKQILHRILAMLINEAADAIHFSICTEEDVETAMTKGVNYPKGLIAWGRELGFRYVVELLDGLYERYHEERYRASPWLRDRM